jgi:adenylate kinase family enzyme
MERRRISGGMKNHNGGKNMKKIMVVGVSPGVGKTTFARSLGEALNIPVYHLDKYYWKPGWVESPLEEFRAAQLEIVKQEKWIIEGNYTNTYDVRVPHADTIIYLELSLMRCLFRVFKRTYSNLGKNRNDVGEGCPERFEWEFFHYILTTHRRRKKAMPERLREMQLTGTQKTIVVLKSKKDIETYLKKIKESRIPN